MAFRAVNIIEIAQFLLINVAVGAGTPAIQMGDNSLIHRHDDTIVVIISSLFGGIHQFIELIVGVVFDLFVHIKEAGGLDNFPVHGPNPPVTIKNGTFIETFIDIHEFIGVNIHSST